jgi:hypothetical protein
VITKERLTMRRPKWNTAAVLIVAAVTACSRATDGSGDGDGDDDDDRARPDAAAGPAADASAGGAPDASGAESDASGEPPEADATAPTADAEPATPAPVIDGLDHRLAPRESRVVVSGSGLADVDTVEIGGVAQGFVIDSDAQLTIGAIDPATPLGLQPVIAAGPAGASAPVELDVAQIELGAAVVAHGAVVAVTVTGLETVAVGDVSAAAIAGAAHPFAIAGDAVRIGPVDEATLTGIQPVSLAIGGEALAPFSIAVMHLVINELDSDTLGADAEEFVEIATGVPGASLDGYVLVLYSGSDDASYRAVALAGAADASGLFVVGNAAIGPDAALPDGGLQNGADAAALYQGSPADVPIGSAVGAVAVPLIDAVVYGTGDIDDPGLLDALLGASGPQRVQADESSGGNPTTAANGRCASALRDGRAWMQSEPTPGAPNSCPP